MLDKVKQAVKSRLEKFVPIVTDAVKKEAQDVGKKFQSVGNTIHKGIDAAIDKGALGPIPQYVKPINTATKFVAKVAAPDLASYGRTLERAGTGDAFKFKQEDFSSPLNFIASTGTEDILNLLPAVGTVKNKATSALNLVGKSGRVDGRDIGYITQNMDKIDRDLMENFIDTIRLRKRSNVKLEIDARQMAEAMGLNPNVPNHVLANKFDRILNSRINMPKMNIAGDGGDLKKIDEIMKEYTPEKAIAQKARIEAQITQKQAGKNAQDILNTAKKAIGQQPEKFNLKQSLKDFYRDWVNRTQPIEDLVSEVEKKAKVSIRPEFNPIYRIQKVLGAGGIAELRHKKVLEPIIEELGDIDRSEFDLFLKAKRDIELAQRGLRGSDSEKAAEIIQALGSKYDISKLEAVANKLYTYQDEGLQALRNSGFIDETTYQTIKDANKNYVPFQRVMDEVSDYIGLPTTKLQQASQVVKKIKGSDRAIQSPLESIIANTYALEGAIAKNEVARSIAGLQGIVDVGIVPLRISQNVKKRIEIFKDLRELGKDRGYVERLMRGSARQLRILQRELDKLNKAGIEQYLKRGEIDETPKIQGVLKSKVKYKATKVMTDSDEFVEWFPQDPEFSFGNTSLSKREFSSIMNSFINETPEKLKAIKSRMATVNRKMLPLVEELEILGKNADYLRNRRAGLVDEARAIRDVESRGKKVLSVWTGGVKELYEIPAEINDAVKGLSEESTNSVIKILSAPARLLRQGATGRNIDFMIPNVVKDQFDAAVTSKYGYVPFVDYLRGLGHLIRFEATGADDVVEGWIKSGGKIFFENMGGRKAIREQVLDATGKTNILKKMGNWVFGGLDTIGKYSETPTRLGLYKRALEATKNPLIAGREAREGTLDFARMGAKMRTANAIIPFLNVGVQGFDKLIRSVKNNPGKVAFNFAVFAGLPAIATTIYNLENHPEEYAEIPQYEKDTNFIIVTGRDDAGRATYIKIPKGNVVPFLANPAEQLVAYQYNANPQDFQKFVLNFMGNALPLVEGGDTLKESASRTVGALIPQALKPAIEDISNYSFFRGREIVPKYMENRPDKNQAYDSTAEMYKQIGRKLNLSPLRVQNFMDSTLGGGYTKVPANIAETIVKLFKGEPVDPDNTVILRRFIGAGDNPEDIQRREEYQKSKAEELESSKLRWVLKNDPEAKGVSTTPTGVKFTQIGTSVIYLGDDGKTHKLNLTEDLEVPTSTGSPNLDRQLLINYKSSVTRRINELLTLTELGILTKEQTGEKLLELDALRNRLDRRINPSSRGTDLSDTQRARSLSDINSQIKQVTQQVGDGEISAQEANSIIADLENQKKSLKKPRIRRGSGRVAKPKAVKVRQPKAKKIKPIKFKFKKPRRPKVKRLKIRKI